jgi:hypothetical protein
MSNRLNSQGTRVTFARHEHPPSKAARSEVLVVFASVGGHAQASILASPVVPALPMAPPAYATWRPRPLSSNEPLSYPLWLSAVA